MHDTLIINIPINPAFVNHIGGDEWGIVGDLHMYGIRAEGEVRFDPKTQTTTTHDLKHPFEKLPSSYANMAIKFYHRTKNCVPYVSLNASPKFIQGHNLFGTDDISELAFEMIGTLKEIYPGFYLFLDVKNAHISRVDFTYFTRIDHKVSMPEIIDMIGRVSVGQRKPDPSRNKFATTRYWGKANNRNGYCKMYAKDDEIDNEIKSLRTKARNGNRTAENLLKDVFTDGLKDFSQNLLRFEATTKKNELEKQKMPTNLWQFILYQRVKPQASLTLWHKWFDPIMDALYGEVMTNYDDAEVLSICLERLTTITKSGKISQTKANHAYRFYCFIKDKGYQHAKEVTDKHTFNRNVKNLVDIGIPKSHLQNLNGRENKSVALCELIRFNFEKQTPDNYTPPKSRFASDFDEFLKPQLQFVA